MNRIFHWLLAGILLPALVLTGCQKKGNAEKNTSEDAIIGESRLKIVLLLNGVLGDKSFFDSAFNGMKLIQEEYGDEVIGKTIEMSYDQTKWEPTLLDVSEENWDIIICGTWQMVEFLQDIAPEHPEKYYIIFDIGVDYSLGNLGNVYSIGYRQNEASFLAGVLAIRMSTGQYRSSKAKAIGFLGGMDIPVINDFLVGYIEGALYTDSEAKVAISYIGSFDDSAKGKEMALAQYTMGVEVGYNVAGQAGLGQLDAAKDAGRYSIGVDSDQAAIFAETDPAKAELIATSILKRVDNSLLRAINLHKVGNLAYGQMEYLGFAEDCVGIADNDIYRRIVPKEIRAELATIEQQIVDKKIEVGTVFGMSIEELDTLRKDVRP